MIERAGDGGAEAGNVGATFDGVDVVDVGVGVFGVLAAVLQGDFVADAVLLAADVNDVGMERFAGAVEVFDEFDDAALVVEFVVLGGLLVLEENSRAAIEEGELLQPLVENVVRELGGLEDLSVGLEGGFGAVLGCSADTLDGAGGNAAFVFLLPDVAVAGDFDLAPFGKEVDDGDADAVQTAGGLVRAFFELAAELEDRHNAFQRGDVAAHFFGELIVLVDRDAAAIVFDGDGTIVVDGDPHFAGEVGHGLVDGIVDDFVDQVVQTAAGAVANVHARPFAHVFQVGQVQQIFGGVLFVGGDAVGGGRIDCFRGFVSHLFCY